MTQQQPAFAACVRVHAGWTGRSDGKRRIEQKDQTAGEATDRRLPCCFSDRHVGCLSEPHFFRYYVLEDRAVLHIRRFPSDACTTLINHLWSKEQCYTIEERTWDHTIVQTSYIKHRTHSYGNFVCMCMHGVMLHVRRNLRSNLTEPSGCGQGENQGWPPEWN